MRAFLSGLVVVVLIGGIGLLVIWFGIFSIFSGDNESMLPYLPTTLLIVGTLAAIVGLGARIGAADKDEENYVISRATPLPIKLAGPLDDVWVTGKMVCNNPLPGPHFNIPCAHFEYKFEEYERRFSGGRTTKKWVTKKEEKETALFGVKDATGHLSVATADARFDHLEKREDETKTQRHTLKYLPVEGQISVAGTVSADGETLVKEGDVPLLVTPKSRADWREAAEKGEANDRAIGLIAVWLGLMMLGWGGAILLKWLPLPEKNWNGLWLPLIISTGLVLIWSVIATLNRLVNYRQRIAHAWSGIDVDLAARYDLVKNLVESVKEHAAHEANTFEAIAAWRGGGTGVPEGTMVQAQADLDGLTRGLRVTVEANPELHHNELTGQLLGQLSAQEEKLTHGRITFNECVREYNDLVETFPVAILAKIGGHKSATLWSIAEDVREEVAPAPKLETTETEG